MVFPRWKGFKIDYPNAAEHSMFVWSNREYQGRLRWNPEAVHSVYPVTKGEKIILQGWATVDPFIFFAHFIKENGNFLLNSAAFPFEQRRRPYFFWLFYLNRSKMRKSPELRRFLDRNRRIGQFLCRKPAFAGFGAFSARFACARASSRQRGRFYICMHITHITRVYAPTATPAALPRSRTPQRAVAAGPGKRGAGGTRRLRVRCAQAASLEMRKRAAANCTPES